MKKWLLANNLLIMASLVINGCGIIELDSSKLNKKTDGKDTVVVVVVDEVAGVNKELVESLKDVPMSDCKILYKVFAGAYQYVDETEKPEKTSELFALIDKVQKDYKWNKERYPKITDIIEKDLISKGFEDNKDIASHKKLVVDTFCVYANSILEAMKAKNNA